MLGFREPAFYTIVEEQPFFAPSSTHKSKLADAGALPPPNANITKAVTVAVLSAIAHMCRYACRQISLYLRIIGIFIDREIPAAKSYVCNNGGCKATEPFAVVRARNPGQIIANAGGCLDIAAARDKGTGPYGPYDISRMCI